MKKVFSCVLVTLLAVILLLLGASLYMLDYALKPEALETRSRDIPGSYTYLYKDYPELRPWVDSLRTARALQDTLIRSERGERLHALYVRAAQPTGKTAVIVHGYTDNAVRMLPIGYLYSRQLGCNILLPDLHAHGESEGEAVRMGWLDRLDVLRWMDTANELFGDSTRMVVHGISMGAATTMMVSGETLPAYVKCFVEDCGYTSVWDEFSGELKNQFGLPTFPLLDVTSWLCGLRYNWTFREASALEQVKKCTLPMFFIHGDKDDFVPTWMVHPLYEAKPAPKELWLVPGAAHAVSYKENKVEYTRRVRDFTGKYIR
ncbi:MAG TPA: alpha/beta hydrolase [Candidatus Bacteroides merdigallinarum]|uniref:Alpha/beta hydrolase n=1 Tax=Candidatus Bacteroides merdigallinarum TaxID=2838473 RepID=A0A9D2J293_9BACE|nr:alpha/beta hydrolase [Candidatus Bacteroides merdigallinarum]